MFKLYQTLKERKKTKPFSVNIFVSHSNVWSQMFYMEIPLKKKKQKKVKLSQALIESFHTP